MTQACVPEGGPRRQLHEARQLAGQNLPALPVGLFVGQAPTVTGCSEEVARGSRLRAAGRNCRKMPSGKIYIELFVQLQHQYLLDV